ncbi:MULTISPECIES: type II secretion system secretin GspD [unclassified Modicisalibacter]|uniref:type II secretion system secretin GspD n=1 Tax=unclassified Modicisalibacter TaxID=2679913 RepID=UPI001CCF37C9|nr:MULTISPECIES: type II secretion system secretin GspD [unclassified Modicisalibacter]MBZ9558097.1 type II secretion system secretin GspD [Modicisalibacter sp. R2A 31.J]MBZ9573234.1 type II secretion system secretin GspD [Modicisalibacter sp. MOD 31.J]
MRPLPYRLVVTLLLALLLPTPALAQSQPQPQPQPPADDTSATAADATPRYDVDFQQTSLREFIDSVGRITGHAFIVDPRVQGNISLTSQRRLSADELYRLFQNELQINGYATVPLADGQVRIVPAQASRTQPLPLGDAAQGANVATSVIATRNLDAATLAGVLQPLVDSQVGTVTPWPESHLVVVTDWRDNLRRLTQLAERLDRQRDLQAAVLPLKHASADELAGTLDTLMQREGGSQVKVVANPRANALVAYGDPAGLARVRQLAASLDKPQAEAQQRNTRVIYLDNVSAESVVSVLGGLTGERPQNAGSADATNQVQQLLQRAGGGGGGGALQGGSLASASNGTGSGGSGLPALPDATSRNAALAGTLGSGDDAVGFAVHPSTNALVLIGPPARLDAYASIIKKLDIRRAQVAVEAIIAEITESRAKRLGVQWLFGDLSGSGTVPVGGFNYAADGQPGINAIAGAAARNDTSQLARLLGSITGASAGVGRISDSGVSFAALLGALQSDSETNLLSTPSLTTLDNAQAYILVGQEVPFVTGSTTFNENPYQIIQREDIGVSLRIRPSISSDNTIRMDIVQEVSSIDPNVQASDVVTNKREIETSVVTRDGGIVVLGGLISNTGNSSAAQVPLLGDIPLLGKLFQYKRDEHEKRNLMVFIRARVLRDAAQMDSATADKYRYMRAQQLLAGFDDDQALAPWSTASAASDGPAPSTSSQTRWSTLFPDQRSRLGSLAP